MFYKGTYFSYIATEPINDEWLWEHNSETQEKCNIFVSINVGNNYNDTVNWVGLFTTGNYNKLDFPKPIETEKRLTQISASTIYYSARTRTRESGITLTAHRQKRRKNKILFPLITR